MWNTFNITYNGCRYTYNMNESDWLTWIWPSIIKQLSWSCPRLKCMCYFNLNFLWGFSLVWIVGVHIFIILLSHSTINRKFVEGRFDHFWFLTTHMFSGLEIYCRSGSLLRLMPINSYNHIQSNETTEVQTYCDPTYSVQTNKFNNRPFRN